MFEVGDEVIVLESNGSYYPGQCRRGLVIGTVGSFDWLRVDYVVGIGTFGPHRLRPLQPFLIEVAVADGRARRRRRQQVGP